MKTFREISVISYLKINIAFLSSETTKARLRCSPLFFPTLCSRGQVPADALELTLIHYPSSSSACVRGSRCAAPSGAVCGSWPWSPLAQAFCCPTCYNTPGVSCLDSKEKRNRKGKLRLLLCHKRNKSLLQTGQQSPAEDALGCLATGNSRYPNLKHAARARTVPLQGESFVLPTQ